MDIISRETQRRLREQEMERRHEERVRAGEEVLGLRPRAARGAHHHRAHAHSSRHHSYLARYLLALAATVVVFGVGSALYVGAKAYRATEHMRGAETVRTIIYTKAPTRDTAQESANTSAHPSPAAPAEAVRSSAPQRSFLRDARAAAGALVGKRTPLRGEREGVINILLLGKGSKGHSGENLTDTIMLARLNVAKGKIALFSIPRDLYVRIPGSERATKINALYDYGLRQQRGAELITRAVATITGVAVHYYLVADFDAFASVVDALGGINVTVTRAIHDTRYPGPGYSYQTFTLAKGLQHLDGATALKYVRSRHDDPEGDFGRAKRQQQVLQAIKNKAFSLGTLSNPLTIGKLLDALGAHIRTNMTLADMTSLVALLPQLDTHNITTEVIDAWQSDSVLRVIHVGRMFALVPRAGRFTYTEIQQRAQTIFERPARERLRTEVAREQPRIRILRAGSTAATVRTVQSYLTDTLGVPAENITVHTRRTPLRTRAALVDESDGTKPFTLTALLSFLGLHALTPATDGADGADITIVLGAAADAFLRPNPITRAQFEAGDAADPRGMIEAQP